MQVAWSWSRFEELGVDALYDALALRCRVFVLEQGAYLDPDGLDRVSWHLLGRSKAAAGPVREGELIAYLRIVDPGRKYDETSIGRVVIAPEVRGTGLGRALMREGLAGSARLWPGHGVRISAQERLRAFYGSLGFQARGDTYLEDGIPHREMLRPARQGA